MKNIFLVLPFLLLVACEKDFEEINTNPHATTEIDPAFLFSGALHHSTGTVFQVEGTMLSHASCYVQHFASLSFNWTGDKYYFNAGQNDIWFNEAYKNDVKLIVDVIDKVSNDPEQINLYSAGRIWKALIFHRLTDLYGDIPYFDAGKGFSNGIFAPKYDAQQEIYLDLLNELDAANEGFNAERPFIGAADFIFEGDIEKWRKFGNTLMLRLALRLTKVDPAAAEKWAKKAIQNGLMTSLDDSALITHSVEDQLFQNSRGTFFETDENGRLNERLVDWMSDSNDPRLAALSVVWTGTEPKGLPTGLDENLLFELVDSFDINSYSRLNPAFTQKTTPTIFLGFAEAEFMLAEASIRGWHNNNASENYRSGVEAAVRQLNHLAGWGIIPETDINQFIADLTGLPNDPTTSLEKISEQYWAATLFNEIEAYSNWRRTGYPVLIPGNFPGNVSGGTIPRRFRYPQNEYSVNGTNLSIANSRQGEDLITTRIWWDK